MKKTTSKKLRIGENSKLGRVLNKSWEDLHIKQPMFWVITGKVGTGKSRSLFLNIIDYWYRHFHNKEIIKTCFGTTFPAYINALNTAKPFDIAGLDEAGDIFNKGARGRIVLNDLYETYGIIRERLIFTVIVMPSIFDLDNKFAQNNVTYWLNAVKRINNKCNKCHKDFVGNICPYCNSKDYKPGCVVYNFYSHKRLKKILQFNESRNIKSLSCGVKPNFTSKLGEYKGKLCDYYDSLKQEKTDLKVKTLDKKYGIKTTIEQNKQAIEVKDMLEKGIKMPQIAEKLGIHQNTCYARLRKFGLKV